MKARDIRKKYLAFFESRQHAVIPAAPIVPPDDPTTLFTSSGMQQLVPYLKGEKHSMGTRLVDSQPSFRAEDIEEVGDNRHTTMFEMLGNWSLGDYFKKEQLSWVWEFFTGELGLDPARLHTTVFEGDESAPKDTESHDIWVSLGVPEEHIHYYPAKKNWWSRAGVPASMPVGEIGGPDSEVFYDFGAGLKMHENSTFSKEECHVNCDCGRFLEIGNSVFMQFVKTEKGMEPLPAQNVDFGGGLERICAAVQNTPDIFRIDMFAPIIESIEKSSGKKYEDEYMSPMRVIADHLRAAVFMGAQGIIPNNKMQGYIMRRLLRRAAVRARRLEGNVKEIFLASIPAIVTEYAGAGFISRDSGESVTITIADELDRFDKVLRNGIRDIEKRQGKLDEQIAFDLYQSVGFPFEITRELVAEKGVVLDENKFNELLSVHKSSSRTASAGMFKGGLADQGETTTKYHTATHLLHQALRDVLGQEVEQAGSNINAERLRFDYTFKGKPTEEDMKKVEQIINEKIADELPVVKTIEDKDAAIASGARSFFREKYPEKVSVYTIGKQGDTWYSKELCGGPHVEHTGMIGMIHILKDENLGSGTRRIYAKLA